MLDVGSETSLRQKRLLSFLFPEVAPLADASDRKQYPRKKAPWYLMVTFWWTNPVMKVGYTRTLEPNDLFELTEDLSVDQNKARVLAELSKLDRRSITQKTLVRLLFRVYWREFMWTMLLGMVFLLLDSVSALVTKALILAIEEKVSGNSGAIGKAIGIAVASSVLTFLVEALVAHYYYLSLTLGTKLRSVFTALIMDKSFRLSPVGRHKFSLTKIMSICTTDLARVEALMLLAPFFFSLPLPIVISIAILAINLGVTSVVAIAMLVTASVSLSFSVRTLFSYRTNVVSFTDTRVNIMKEIVANLKLIKFYNWEVPYLLSLMSARTAESKMVLKIQTMRNFLTAFMISLTPIVLMVSFIVLHAIEGTSRLAASIFSSVQSFSSLAMVLANIPMALSSLADFLNGMKRVADLLSQPENEDTGHYIVASNSSVAVDIREGTFIWETFDDEEEETDNKDQSGTELKSLEPDSAKGESKDASTKLTSLNDINLTIPKGEFVVVTGSIGSGKSSLLNAIAGFMTCEDGSVTIDGSLVLCGELWILNSTVRENILFGAEWDHEWYDKVIYACSLQTDLDKLDAGDLTEVGEKGITLSGGQKARICLARAVYANTDIILMDDVLSAVDARVGKHIMRHCCENLLLGKTRILATHQLSLIASASKIIFLNGDGTLEMGTMESLSSNPKFANLLSYNQQQVQAENVERETLDGESDLKEEGVDITETIVDEILQDRPDQVLIRRRRNNEDEEDAEFIDIHANKDASKGKIITVEEKAVNSLKSAVYKSYVKFGVGRLTVPGFLIIFGTVTALAVFTEIFSTTWLTFWISDKFERESSFYAGIYVMLTLLFFVLLLVEFVAVAVVAGKSLRLLNIAAAKKVLKVPMSFLDVTPVGRILNRFTKDTDALDNEIADNLKRLIHSFSYIIGLIVLNVIYIPWVALSIPVLSVAYIAVANYYQASSREIKRLEAVQRSFVINNISETLFGMKTIRAFDKGKLFLDRTETSMDTNNEATFMSNAVSRWLAINLQAISSVFGMAICVLSASGAFNLLAAAVGMLVNNVIGLSFQLSSLTSFVTQVENDMNSAERLIFYASNLPQEAEGGLEPPNWPKLGKLEFDNVSMLYRPGLPLVLKNISFKVQSGEKIGICGRTGAGKSSIMAAIYRLHELDGGTILYDHIDISRLSLDALRSKLSIIPQEPVLFAGTIRKNLDPFGQHADLVLWDALKRSEILSEEEIATEQTIKDADAMHKFNLDQEVSEEGSNYSVGERQLISFARALVRDTKILILDEATSSVDYETDHKIQNTINREFSHCTILCIAHRLKTILHYDRIMTLDSGEIAEFDKPLELYKQNGIFRLMCERSAITSSDF